MDNNGKKIYREPAINDFIKINLMVPNYKSGDGFDRVQIEQMVEKENEDHTAFNSINVRLAICPTNESKGIVHFFNEAATTTFIILKKEDFCANLCA